MSTLTITIIYTVSISIATIFISLSMANIKHYIISLLIGLSAIVFVFVFFLIQIGSMPGSSCYKTQPAIHKKY